MRGVVCLFLGQVCEGVERAKVALPVELFLGRVPGGLLSAEWLASFVRCVGERVCVAVYWRATRCEGYPAGLQYRMTKY